MPRGLATIRRCFDINRAIRVFAATLVIAVLVMTVAEARSGSPGWTPILWQALVIAALSAVAVEWAVWRSAPDAPPDEQEHRADAAHAPPEGGRLAGSLEQQGITNKLLELIALGERYGNTFSLALISLDYLDEMGEFYEKDVIEELLDRVLSALAHTLRMPDRVGCYERGTFVVVLPETNLPGAVQIAERLRAAVAAVDVAVSSRVHVHTTASVGVTCFRRGDDLQAVLERGQKTLRRAQQQGRNRVLPDIAA